jgi:hypothetical protein
MKREYEIIKETVRLGDVMSKHVLGPGGVVKEYPRVIAEGKEFVDKYFIHYYGGEYNGTKEFHSLDGVNTEITILPGYTLKQNQP